MTRYIVFGAGAIGGVATLDLGPDDVVLLAVKGQDTQAALQALAPAGPGLPVVCLQNGVANETALLRHLRDGSQLEIASRWVV